MQILFVKYPLHKDNDEPELSECDSNYNNSNSNNNITTRIVNDKVMS